MGNETEIAVVICKDRYDLFFNTKNSEIDLSPIRNVINTAD